MKSSYRLFAAAVVTACLVPAICTAQTSSPVTRQQVRDELAALEAVGYNPHTAEFSGEPQEMQAAMARLYASRNLATARRAGSDGNPSVDAEAVR